ncbi:MAG: division/cell wall cluster transcriptional repressor MraZ [Nitrospirae bacterium]|nr:MAG: division/cell wall cluster transcriptional repressor MraZ [Nitrospirota bacterium]
MFAGQYHCKLDEKGRFIVPSPIREQLEAEGERVIFVKGQDLPLSAYSLKGWQQILEQAKATLDDDQSRFFMHFLVAEAASAELDKAGRILIPGRLRKAIPLDEEQEIVLLGMYHRLEIWNPTDWRRYLHQRDEQYEQHLGRMLALL